MLQTKARPIDDQPRRRLRNPVPFNQTVAFPRAAGFDPIADPICQPHPRRQPEEDFEDGQ